MQSVEYMKSCVYTISFHSFRLSVYFNSEKMNHSNNSVISSDLQKHLKSTHTKLHEELNSILNERFILSTRHVNKLYLKAQSELKPQFNNNEPHTSQWVLCHTQWTAEWANLKWWILYLELIFTYVKQEYNWESTWYTEEWLVNEAFSERLLRSQSRVHEFNLMKRSFRLLTLKSESSEHTG